MQGVKSEPKHILQTLSGKRKYPRAGKPENPNCYISNIYSLKKTIRNAQNQSKTAGVWYKNQRRAGLEAHGKDEFGKNIDCQT